MVSIALVACGVSAILSFAVSLWVRGWAMRAGFVDEPGGRKQHRSPVALGGGIAIFLAIALPILVGTVVASLVDPVATPSWLPMMIRTHLSGIASKLPLVLGLVGCMSALFAVGLLDDRKALGPIPKLAVQVAVALVTAWVMGVRAAEALPVPISIALTVVWIVVITNAFNFLDNMDGLAAGVGAIAAALFAMTAFRVGQIFVPVMACIVVGALVGFLILNFSPARIFMGDAGSLVIGYVLSVLTILTTFYDPRQHLLPAGVIVPIIVLAVPLYDVASVVMHRLRAGESPFRGDRRHFSHRLVNRGMTTRGAVLTIYLATAATGLPAIVLPRVGWLSACLILAQCCCVVAMIAILEHTRDRKP